MPHDRKVAGRKVPQLYGPKGAREALKTGQSVRSEALGNDLHIPLILGFAVIGLIALFTDSFGAVTPFGERDISWAVLLIAGIGEIAMVCVTLPKFKGARAAAVVLGLAFIGGAVWRLSER